MDLAPTAQRGLDSFDNLHYLPTSLFPTQKQRWLAAAHLDIEPRLRRIKGVRALPLLRQALLIEIGGERTAAATQAA